MKSLRLVLTASARGDLRRLHQYLSDEKGSPLTAERFVEDLADKLHYLAQNGICGTPREQISSGLRAYPYRGWCFYLREMEGKLFVVRVLSSKQDVEDQVFPER